MTTISGVIFWRWEIPLPEREREREFWPWLIWYRAIECLWCHIQFRCNLFTHIFFGLSRYIVRCFCYSIIFTFVQQLFNFLQWNFTSWKIEIEFRAFIEITTLRSDFCVLFCKKKIFKFKLITFFEVKKYIFLLTSNMDQDIKSY